VIQKGGNEVKHAATFADGLAVQIVLDAARESDTSGRTIRIERRDDKAAA
jgi:hypothetical protein